jgi:hypothetical protein
LPDGGTRVTIHMPEAWVAYAAAGGAGPAPAVEAAPGGAGGGLAAPPAMATATLDIDAGYALRWRYQLPGGEVDGPAGTPAGAPPALSDDQLVAALDGARLRARAPRAMPAREPRPLEGHPDILEVDLWALGSVYVPAGEPVEVDRAAPTSTLLALLSAAGALPPGMLPGDLLDTAQVVDGELIAEAPAPLVEWSAGDGIQRSPRVRGVRTGAEMARPGRVRLDLDALRWTLEVGDGGTWRPATGGGP